MDARMKLLMKDVINIPETNDSDDFDDHQTIGIVVED